MKIMLRMALWVSLMIVLPVASGCANWPVRPSAKGTLTETRHERRSAAVQAFEEQRDRALLEAAIDRWNQGDVAGCESRLRAILARRPDDIEAHIHLAELAWAYENHTEAEAEYRAALQLAPERADLQHALGLLLETTGRQAEAAGHFARAAELDPQINL
jgi:Tfp pilus assembly protein PilF